MKRLLHYRALTAICALAALALFWLVRPHPPTVPLEVVRSQLVLRDGVLYFEGGQKAYTGLLVENYGPGKRKLAIEINDGKADGLSRGWYESGQREVEEHFVAGVSHGARERWYPNGQRRSLEQIEHGQVAGTYVEWYDNGQKAVQMALRNGQPDGVVEAWHRSGVLKSRSRMDRGKLLERKFFDDAIAAR